MATELEPVNVSALNQYAYCPRRCALIYLESEFADNVCTSRGNAEHERVDRTAHATSKDGARVEYALPIWSERLGLIGKCDVVEFWPDGTVYPVEYKHGAKKQRDNDDLQLTAQSLCLEEMLGQAVMRGAIFHAKSRRRREVKFDNELRTRVEETTAAIRNMLQAGNMPSPINNERCRACSLIDLCQPEALTNLRQHESLRSTLFDPEH